MSELEDILRGKATTCKLLNEKDSEFNELVRKESQANREYWMRLLILDRLGCTEDQWSKVVSDLKTEIELETGGHRLLLDQAIYRRVQMVRDKQVKAQEELIKQEEKQ